MLKKFLYLLMFSSLILSFSFFHTSNALCSEKESIEEKILDILLEKRIISKDQYESLINELKKQDKQRSKHAKVVFNKGFSIESPDGSSRIKFDGRFHGDFKSYTGSHPEHSCFYVRRARLCASGTIYNHYDFRVEPEFGKGGSKLNDGFMNIHYWPWAQLKFGQFKTPFSMEEQQSDNWIDFIERSLANKLVPSRDVGVMLHGGVKEGMLYYQAGIFNGYKQNKAEDLDNKKDIAIRVVYSPFIGSKGWFLKGIHIGGALTRGRVMLPRNEWWNSGKLQTSAGTTYLSFKNRVIQEGMRTRKGLEFNWGLGPMVIQGEYMDVELDGLKFGNQKDNFDITGGYLYLSWFLTGERFVFKNGRPGRVIPLRPFHPKSPDTGWGAFQIGGRWEFVKADSDLLNKGYVDEKRYTDNAKGFTIGINWYPNEMVRLMLNFSHINFDDPILVEDKRIHDENFIISRIEIVF